MCHESCSGPISRNPTKFQGLVHTSELHHNFLLLLLPKAIQLVVSQLICFYIMF